MLLVYQWRLDRSSGGTYLFHVSEVSFRWLLLVVRVFMSVYSHMIPQYMLPPAWEQQCGTPVRTSRQGDRITGEFTVSITCCRVSAG